MNEREIMAFLANPENALVKGVKVASQDANRWYATDGQGYVHGSIDKELMMSLMSKRYIVMTLRGKLWILTDAGRKAAQEVKA